MSYVAAVLLMNSESDEIAFWMLLSVLEHHLHIYFNKKMSGILE
jgi:hypothetical protein